jgi:hypothetical protein
MQDNSAIVRRFVEETINQGQIDSAVQFAWEDVVEQVPFPGQGNLGTDGTFPCFLLRFGKIVPANARSTERPSQ